jgi:outer membrane scaffolding protein for murein synthesis (MipA/OmpV family)
VKPCLAGCALALLAAAAPAAAQERTTPTESRRNSLTVGIGGAYIPSYEGSDDYAFTPVAFVFGRVAGIGFATRGTALYIDVVPKGTAAAFSIDAGPVGNLRLDRSHLVRDRQVAALGNIGPAIELGGFVGLTKNRVLHAYDTLGVRLAVTTDVTDTHHSRVVTPSIEYMTPLSTRTAVNLSASAEHVGDGFAQTYYGVSPAGAVRSGLPVYTPLGGWKSWRLGLVVAQVITGDLRRPHLSAFAGVSYGQVLGSFRRSPVVAIVGDPNQYAAGAGLAYSF